MTYNPQACLALGEHIIKTVWWPCQEITDTARQITFKVVWCERMRVYCFYYAVWNILKDNSNMAWDRVNEQATKGNWLIIGSRKILRKATFELVAVRTVAPIWCGPVVFSSLKFEKKWCENLSSVQSLCRDTICTGD